MRGLQHAEHCNLSGYLAKNKLHEPDRADDRHGPPAYFDSKLVEIRTIDALLLR